METLGVFGCRPVREGIEAGDGWRTRAGNTHALMHHHPTLFMIIFSLAFEKCTGAQAAVQYVAELNTILFVISTLLSPLGMGYFAITKVINLLLDRSCKQAIAASPLGRREFWTFEEIFQTESKRAPSQGKVKFVQDFLLGPIYNVCRFLGKLGTSCMCLSPDPSSGPPNPLFSPTLLPVLDRQGLRYKH